MEVTPVEDRMARVGPDHCRRSSNPRDRRHCALSRRDKDELSPRYLKRENREETFCQAEVGVTALH